MRAGDGHGQRIHREDLQRIFDEFWQVEGRSPRTFDAAGLGLAISRGLARQLGGDIEVESEPGKGSVFSLTLPIATDAGAAQPAQVVVL